MKATNCLLNKLYEKSCLLAALEL